MPAPLFPFSRTAEQWRDDSELVAACLGGDRSAWDALVERYGRLVYSVARRYGMSPEDSDEVFQDVFVICYRKLEGLRDVDRLAAWLVRTTYRECYRVGIRASRHAHAQPDEEAAEPGEDEVVAMERQHLVHQALQQLGGRCERLLNALFLMSGEPNYQAIADDLGMKIGSIGPTRARCFSKLQPILEKMGLEIEG